MRLAFLAASDDNLPLRFFGPLVIAPFRVDRRILGGGVLPLVCGGDGVFREGPDPDESTEHWPLLMLSLGAKSP